MSLSFCALMTFRSLTMLGWPPNSCTHKKGKHAYSQTQNSHSGYCLTSNNWQWFCDKVVQTAGESFKRGYIMVTINLIKYSTGLEDESWLRRNRTAEGHMKVGQQIRREILHMGVQRTFMWFIKTTCRKTHSLFTYFDISKRIHKDS